VSHQALFGNVFFYRYCNVSALFLYCLISFYFTVVLIAASNTVNDALCILTGKLCSFVSGLWDDGYWQWWLQTSYLQYTVRRAGDYTWRS